MSEQFISQSSNFISAFSGAVDPRTGMYGYNFTLAHLIGNAGLGPELPITLSYSPLTTNNSGFGTGVTLQVSFYDKGNRTLQLSTGERYRVNEAGGILNVIHAKPLNFRISIRNDGYYIFYKNGITECLTSPSKGGNIKVTERIISPAGRELTLKWETYGNSKRLLSVSDESIILLNIRYNAGGATFSVWPETAEAHTVILRTQNDLLISIQNTNLSPALTWTLAYSNKKLISVISPTGLQDRVTWSQTGHKFPLGGPSGTLPYVISHRQTGHNNQLIRNLRYTFSDKNFLGYGGSNQTSWNSDTDFLYGILGDYEYSSTEIALDSDNSSLSRTVRTYSNYHLQIKEFSTIVGTTCHSTTETTYYSVKGKNFDSQPPQFQFPLKQTVTLTDTSKPVGQQARTETTLSKFDEQGNPVSQKSPDGTLVEYEYYPPEGDGENCPPEPNGFIRFLKKKTLTPRTTKYDDTLPEVTQYTYCTLGDTDRVVQKSQKTYSGNQLLWQQITQYNTDKNNQDFGRITELTHIKYDGAKGFISKQLFTSIPGNGALTQQVTTIGHDGLVAIDSRSSSTLSGLLFCETDSQGVKTEYKYDLAGRLISQTAAAGSAFEKTATWSYTIEESGPVTTYVDPTGNQQKILFDSAGREIGRQQFDPDTTQKFYLTSSQTFDMLGRSHTATRSDWLTAIGNHKSFDLQTTVDHDDWGAPQIQTFSDLTRYHQATHPVELTRVVYAQGGEGNQKLNSGRMETKLDAQTHLPLTTIRTDTTGQTQGVRHFSWDGRGQLRKDTDELNNTTTRFYDAYGRLTTQTLPDGSVVTRTYAPHLTDELISTISITGPNANGEIQTWLAGTQEFDSLGRVTRRAEGGRITTFIYKGTSLSPSKIILPSGKKLQYTYIPELGNAVSSVSAEGITQTFNYDPKTGRLLQEREENVTNNYLWKASGSLQAETFTRNTGQNATHYTSTLAGEPVSYQDITHSQTVYDYDKYGRMVSLVDAGLKTTFEYDVLGRLCQQTVENNTGTDTLTTVLEYDDFNRETKQVVTDSIGASLTTVSSWTKNGLLASRHLTVSSGDHTHRHEAFNYDARNRLIRYKVTGTIPVSDACGLPLSEQTYQYDALNNLTIVISTLSDGNSDIMTYHYENTDDPTQLTSVTHTHASYPQRILLKYDPEGRMILDEAGRTLTYDVLGRLSTIEGENCPGGRYGYDAGNRLVSQNIGTGEVRQLYYRGTELVNEVTSL